MGRALLFAGVMSEGETTTVSDDLVCEEILLSADGTDVNEEILQISQKILNQNVQASGKYRNLGWEMTPCNC